MQSLIWGVSLLSLLAGQQSACMAELDSSTRSIWIAKRFIEQQTPNTVDQDKHWKFVLVMNVRLHKRAFAFIDRCERRPDATENQQIIHIGCPAVLSNDIKDHCIGAIASVIHIYIYITRYRRI